MDMTTRGVLAVIVVVLMTVSMVVSRRGNGTLAAWLLTISFAAAAGWAGLGVVWTHQNGPEGAMTPQLYASLLVTGLAFALYFGVRARNSEEAFDS
ncbi:hypothetical protein [Haloparvum alkalitolerans]|uniref:hypothetical protein n=1 Tax=Haloparvum alkalitolerans TaxID=1042953 RepID=UPI003CEB6197